MPVRLENVSCEYFSSISRKCNGPDRPFVIETTKLESPVSSKLKNRLANLGLLTGSVLFALVLVEYSVGWLVPIRDVGPSFSVHDPILLKRLKPNFTVIRRTPEFTMHLSTNRFGFRGPQLEKLPSDAILFLGDSFTMGYGVNDGDEFPAIVEARLKNKQGAISKSVVNTGIGNTGNGRWIKILTNLAVEIKPRLVIMQVFGNDFSDNGSERMFALGDDGGLRQLQDPPPTAGRWAQRVIEMVPGLSSSNLVGLVRQISWSLQPTHDATAWSMDGKLLPSDALTLRILERAVLICQQHGWKALALVVGLEGERARAVVDQYEKYGVTVISLPSRSQRPDLYYKIDGHWNASGHAFVADQLMPHLLVAQ
jgi:hypothetical protein